MHALILADKDAGSLNARLALSMLLSVAAAGPCPALGHLVASLRAVRDVPLARRCAANAGTSSAAAEIRRGLVSGKQEEDYALWVLAGCGARAAVPALRAAARKENGAGGRSAAKDSTGPGGWGQSVAAGKDALDALGRCRHWSWRGLHEGLAQLGGVETSPCPVGEAGS